MLNNNKMNNVNNSIKSLPLGFKVNIKLSTGEPYMTIPPNSIKYSILLQNEIENALRVNPNTNCIIIAPPKEVYLSEADVVLVFKFIRELDTYCKLQEHQYIQYEQFNQSQAQQQQPSSLLQQSFSPQQAQQQQPFSPHQQQPTQSQQHQYNQPGFEKPTLNIKYTNEYGWYKSFKLSKQNKRKLIGACSKYVRLEGRGIELVKLIVIANYFSIIDNYLVKAFRKSLESNLDRFKSVAQAISYFGDPGEEFLLTEKLQIQAENAFSENSSFNRSSANTNFIYNSMVDRVSNHHHNNSMEVPLTTPFNINDGNNGGGVDENPADIVQLLEPRKPNLPLPSSSNCFLCTEKLSYGKRHHCRECGMVFCSKCASNFVEPEYLPGAQIYYGVKDYLYKYISNKTCRLCETCYKKLDWSQRLVNDVFILKVLALKFRFLRKLASIYPQWRRATLIYLSQVRMIQYKFPTHKLLEYEKLVLWRNREDLRCHSLWLLKLLCSIDYTSITNKQLKSLELCLQDDPKDKKDCYYLMCSSSCQNKISPLNIIPLLDKNITHPFIRSYATRQLHGLGHKLLYVLPQLTFLLRYESNVQSDLATFLFEASKTDTTIAFNFLWELKNCQCGEFDLRYEALKLEFTNYLSKESPDAMKGYQLGFELSHILQQHKPLKKGNESFPNFDYLEKKLDQLVKQITDSNGAISLKLPTNPIYSIMYFKVKESKVFKSATKPLYLVCHCKNDQTGEEGDFGLIFKQDDLRKDQNILNLIYLMNDIIVDSNERQREKQLKFLQSNPSKVQLASKKMKEPFMQPVVYRVLPTGVNYGFIEPVKNSKTLKQIYDEHDKKITKFLNNGSYDEGSQNFSKSLATWNIITHLLGVGDRHHENVMFTEDKQIFHIDYGFIFIDPKFFSSVIRNDLSFEDQFLDNEKKKEDFYDLCVRLFLQLRKHHSFFLYQITFLTRLEPKVGGLIDESYIEDVIGYRFLPGVPKKEATEYLKSLLKNPINSFAISFFDAAREYRDKFLKVQEKTTKSVSEMSYNLFGKIYNYTTSSSQSITIENPTPIVSKLGEQQFDDELNNSTILSNSISGSSNGGITNSLTNSISSKLRNLSLNLNNISQSITQPQLSNTYPVLNDDDFEFGNDDTDNNESNEPPLVASRILDDI